MCGYGGGLFRVGPQELLYNSLLVDDNISHIIHVVIHFVEYFVGNVGGWIRWLGRHGGVVCADKLVGASTGLDLPVKALVSFK